MYEYSTGSLSTSLVHDISYTYSNQDVIEEIDALANTTKEYVYGNEVDDLVASIQNSITNYYEKNHL